MNAEKLAKRLRFYFDKWELKFGGLLSARDQIFNEVAKGVIEEMDAEKLEKPELGFATTAQLLNELSARARVCGYADYRTVDGEILRASKEAPKQGSKMPDILPVIRNHVTREVEWPTVLLANERTREVLVKFYDGFNQLIPFDKVFECAETNRPIDIRK